MTAPRRALVWANPNQENLARSLVAAGGLSVVAAGSPGRAHAGSVATALGVPPIDDLRAVLAQAGAPGGVPGDCPALLLLAPASTDAGQADEDARTLAAAAARGVRIITLEPVPSDVLELGGGAWRELETLGSASIRMLGLPRLSPVFREARETLAAFAQPRTVVVQHWSAPHHGSLFARLVGAVDLAHALTGEAEVIDAVYVPRGLAGRTATGGSGVLPFDGDLSASIRTSDGRAAIIAVSNAASRWDLCVTLLGEAGRLTFTDNAFTWLAPDGTVRDEHRPPADDPGDHAVTLFAGTLRRVLDTAQPDDGPLDVRSVLPVAHAAALSARTATAEGPRTFRAMMTAS